jgi:hypothetical protein
MAACSRCGGQLNPQERFCGNCGLDTQAAPQQTVPQQTVPQAVVSQQTMPQQVVYTPPAAQAAPTASGHRCGCTERAAMGLGIGGGLIGILWGALGPYLTVKFPAHIAWGIYGTGLRTEILLIIGLVAGALAIVGAACATKAVPVARVLLVICGLGGFVLGASWLVPGALILAAAGLAIAAKPQQ